jgi:hypothetical protein
VTFIEKIAKGGEAVIEAIKWPFIEQSIKRQADDVVDTAEQDRLETEAKIAELQARLAKTTDKGEQRSIFKAIVAQREELELSAHFAELAVVERDKLFAKVDK